MLDWHSAILRCLLTVSFSFHGILLQYDHTFRNYNIESLNDLEFDLEFDLGLFDEREKNYYFVKDLSNSL